MGADGHGAIENLELPWYLAVGRTEQHFVCVDFDLKGEEYRLMGVNVKGEVFDRLVGGKREGRKEKD